METYLITYGADDDLATFEAESMDQAIEQFIEWADFSPDYVVKKTSINSVYLCLPFDWTD